jgi:hypothetical protein
VKKPAETYLIDVDQNLLIGRYDFLRASGSETGSQKQ